MATSHFLTQKLETIMQVGIPLLVQLHVDISKYTKGINIVKGELDK